MLKSLCFALPAAALLAGCVHSVRLGAQSSSGGSDPALPAPHRVWSGVEELNEGWLYREQDSAEIPSAPEAEWQAIRLPHTWNAEDTLHTKEYRRGASWYRRHLKLAAAELEQRVFVRFGAAGQVAEVFVNGERVGEHLGGYSAFAVELTGKVRAGDNRLDVRVSNAPRKDIAPVGDGLFNLYGGLYRGAELIRAPRDGFRRDYRGGPGVRVWSGRVSEQEADVQVRAPGVEGTISAELADPAGRVVATGSGPASGFALSNVKSPALWSPEQPALYTLTARLMREGREADRAVVRHGFRWFEFTPDRGFFLNGRSYPLRGVNRHQDFRGEGNALGRPRHFDDIRLMKELGANWLRLAHYQQDDYVLQLCDELGLLVWEEIPWVRDSPGTPEFERNVEGMLVEMIEQHFNHPAVLLWGMGNEIWFKKGPDGRAAEYDFVKRLHAAIRREDPGRRSVIVSGDANAFSDLKIMSIPDVIGYNLYQGWYGGTVDKLTARLQDLHRRDPGKPMILSEFGAGADIDQHSAKPKTFDQTQEYQVFFLESYLRQLEALPWLCGYNWWNFADFGWGKSANPPLYNNKGLVTFDRRKKDSFQLFKAHHSDAPVLYLVSPSWTNRGGAAEAEYRVITNLKEVELFHQGRSLGAQTDRFLWPVTLQPGANALLARSGRHEHGFTVQYQPAAAATNAAPALPMGEDANPFKK